MFGECGDQITNIFFSKENYQYGKSKSKKGSKESSSKEEGCCKEAQISVSQSSSL
jgi:hypothetical protein